MLSERDPGYLYSLCVNALKAWNNRVSSFTDAEAEAAFQDIRDWLNDDRNPREAAARYTHQQDNSAPLHVLAAANPPLDLVQQIIDLAPETACQLTSDRRSPLEIARDSQSTDKDVIYYLQVSELYALCKIALVRLNASNEEGQEASAKIQNLFLKNNQNPREAAGDSTKQIIDIFLNDFDSQKEYFKLFCCIQNWRDERRQEILLHWKFQKILQDELIDRKLPTSILLLDFYCAVAAIVCNGIASSRYNAYIFGQSTDAYRTIFVESVILLLVGSYFLVRQTLQVISLTLERVFKIWKRNTFNYLEVLCAFSMIISAILMLTSTVNYESPSKGKEAYRWFSTFFSGLYFVLLFPIGRRVFLRFAIFEKGMCQAFSALVGFGIFLFTTLTTFALMFYVVFKKYPENQCSKFCTFKSTWFQVFNMMLGNYGPDAIFSISNNTSTNEYLSQPYVVHLLYTMMLGNYVHHDDIFLIPLADPTFISQTALVYVLFGILVNLMMLSILVAMLFEVYKDVKNVDSGRLLFWETRLEFAVHVRSIFRFNADCCLGNGWSSLEISDRLLFLVQILIEFISFGILLPRQFRKLLWRIPEEAKGSNSTTKQHIEALENIMEKLKAESD